MPRPCVAMSIALSRGWIVISSTRMFGKFAPLSRRQLLPRSIERKMPVSVGRYSTSGFFRSSVIDRATSPLRFALSDRNVAPKSLLTQMCVSKSFNRCASCVTYTVPASNFDGDDFRHEAALHEPGHPVRQRLVPRLAAVLRHAHDAIVRAGVVDARLLRRFAHGDDRTAS